MKNPILFMLTSPSCPPGWHPVPGAAPPRSGDAVALVLSSLYPIGGSSIIMEQAEALASCLPPEDYRPSETVATPPPRLASLTVEVYGFLFSFAALDFVRAHHHGVQWAPGGADGFHTITEIDLLHGFVNGRCVACVCRMRPTPEGP